MKKAFITAFATLLLCVGFFVAADMKLYYYGKNDLDYGQRLPLGVVPVFDFDFPGKFYLADDEGFALVSAGDCQYRGSSEKFTVERILRYGYTKGNILAMVQDTSGVRRLLTFTRSTDATRGGPELTAKVTVIDSEPVIGNVTWIDIDIADLGRIGLVRNWLRIAFVIIALSLAFLGIRLYRRRRSP